MSKAIEGAALIAGAVAMGVGLALDPALVANPFYLKAMFALGAAGVSMEAGAIAGALTSNRGMDISTRQAAAARQIIYGTQRVGGNIVYPSTTGSHHNQYNRAIVIAGHVVSAIEALYLNGRRVYFQTGPGTVTSPNGTYFGGSADSNTYTGPDGQPYNFGGLVYCEPRYGTQLPGDVIGGFTANDPNWAANASGSPYGGGCAYAYLKIKYSPTLFPSEPEIRFTVWGKPVYDPRTGTKGYSSNAALICADWASDAVYGLGLTVNQAQLIAAANVCDEQVAIIGGGGGTEARYACHYKFDTSAPPSDVFATLLKSMGGRFSMIGGECYLWPAYWQGPSFSFDESVLTAPIQYDPYLSYKDLCNRVTGTYTAPNFPYNIAGNFYDSNGFRDGEIQNNFQFGFQPTNFPQYAADMLHGYPADEYLNQDSGVTAAWDAETIFELGQVVSYTQVVAGVSYPTVVRSLINGNIGNEPTSRYLSGVTPIGQTANAWINAAVALPREVSYNMVLSITQAQRLAKIEMMRSRFPGGGTFEMGLSTFAMQEIDVMNFTFPLWGWNRKTLEIINCTFKTITREGSPGEPPPPVERRIEWQVHETDPSIYAWSTAEEDTIYSLPALPPQQLTDPAPPTTMALISNASTAYTSPNGTVTERIEVTWATPLDGFVTMIQVQYQISGAATWTNSPSVDVALNSAYISPIDPSQTYNVQIRSQRSSGATSVWVEIAGFIPTASGTAPAPPTSMALLSDGTTAVVAPNGTVTPRIRITWVIPADTYVNAVQTAYRLSGTLPWTNGATLDSSVTVAYISPVVYGEAYDIRIRSQRPDGSVSVWEEINGFVPGSAASIPAAPGSLELISNSTTALVGPDGTVTPRIEVLWTAPADPYVTLIQLQHRQGSTIWTTAVMLDVGITQTYISPIISGVPCDVRIRSQRPDGSVSGWEEIDGFTTGIAITAINATGVGIGSLVGIGYSDGTGAIECNPFLASIGPLSLYIFPSGEVTLTGLTQNTLYSVYYVDPNAVGGNLTPIATTNPADYLGKQGYYLIDKVLIPANGSTQFRLKPSAYQDFGTRNTLNPTAAYDNLPSTFATVSGSASASGEIVGAMLVLSGFPAVATTFDEYSIWIVFADVEFTSGSTITVTRGSESYAAVVSAGAQTYAGGFPSSAITDLSTFSLTIAATAVQPSAGAAGSCFAQILDVYMIAATGVRPHPL